MAATDTSLTVGFPHFASMEVRVLIEGSEVIVGIPVSKIPGDLLRDKRNFLLKQAIDDIQRLVEDGGFIAVHDHTKPLLLPTGFVYIYASRGYAGLRWSCSSDEGDTTRNMMNLEMLLESFPELRKESLGMTSAEFMETYSPYIAREQTDGGDALITWKHWAADIMKHAGGSGPPSGS